MSEENYNNDRQFEETKITNVSEDSNGWAIGQSDGWSLWVPPTSPVVPKVGMTARLYGRGIGFTVRGLFLDGIKVYYRTEAEDEEKREIEIYGIDAHDWLNRWDEGKTCWSIEMGGLGPGYEQAIHIAMAEILRHLLDSKYDHAAWKDVKNWERDRKKIEKISLANKRTDSLGLSGAQWGSALNLACCFYRLGPRATMKDTRCKDRKIQVSRTFPSVD